MADVNWHEAQYNPRILVPHAGDIIEGWRKRSAEARSRLNPLMDIKYGPHRRENYDLFRASNAKGTLIFIHGGYWRMLSKLESSLVAEPFVQAGNSVALFNYPLCPDVGLANIRASIVRAYNHLCSETLAESEKRRILVSGHSAGGHLAALFATVEMLAHPFHGIASLSGVFDVEPLINTSMNLDLRLTAETARPLNLLAATPVNTAPLLVAVGAEESEEFHAQSRKLAQVWNGAYLPVAATNHFTIVHDFSDPASDLHRRVLNMLAG
jgi:arylformamidase